MNRNVAEPISLAGILEAVRGEGPLLVRGAGTKRRWQPLHAASGEGPPAFVLSLARLNRMLAYHPAEGTATVQAGMSLAELQEEVAVHRQWLAVDPPLVAAGATVGGVYAAGDHGPRRLRYGTLRDLVIGSTVVLADGRMSRSGGNVIKNVAGYDLPKLWHGSMGTLGIVTELTVRLHPQPHETTTVRIASDPATATQICGDVLASPLEAVALEWEPDPEGNGSLWLQLEGRRSGLRARTRDVQRLLAGRRITGLETCTDDEEAAAWSRLREAHAGEPDETVLRAATLPSRLDEAVTALTSIGRDGVTVRVNSHAGIGVHTARLSGGDPLAHAAAAVAAAQAIGALGGHVALRQRSDAASIPLSPLPELHSRVKERLDPARRLPSLEGAVAW